MSPLWLFVRYHSTNRWAEQIDLFDNTHSPISEILAMADFAGDTIVATMNNTTIPEFGTINSYTSYIEVCTNVPSGINASIIGVAAELESQNLHLLHHNAIFGYDEPNCQGTEALFFGWTPGREPLVLESPLGIPIGDNYGGHGAFQSVKINMHYDNRQNVAGVTDSSGVRLYLTPNGQRRPVEVGLLTLGNLIVTAMPTNDTLPVGASRYDFQCNASATTSFPHDITVMAHMAHMHQMGAKLATTVSRGNAPIVTMQSEYFQFSMQSDQWLDAPFVLRRGDSISTSCYFWNDGLDGTKRFGLGSSDEMCQDFVSFHSAVHLVNLEL